MQSKTRIAHGGHVNLWIGTKLGNSIKKTIWTLHVENISSVGLVVSEKKIFPYQPIRNKNFRCCSVVDGLEGHEKTR